MLNRKFSIIFLLCPLVLLSAGCEQKKTGQGEESAAYEDSIDEPLAQEAPGGGAARPAPPKNEPISYGTPGEDDYVIYLGRFNSRSEAENYSRELRRQRINNYVFARDSGVYYVLMGPFVSRKQADRRLGQLTKRGFIKAEVYAANDLR